MDHGTIDFGPFRLEAGPDRLCRRTEEIALRPKGLWAFIERVLTVQARNTATGPSSENG